MNIAFIDGQNLNLGTKKQEGWSVDYKKFRIYMKDKYSIQEAYYFIGYEIPKHKKIYDSLKKDDYIIKFKKHDVRSVSIKKGNVDIDLVFFAMKYLLERKDTEKIFIVSGDGDYYRLITYLISKGHFGKILFPNKKYRSSLYKTLGDEYTGYLSSIKNKIKYLK